jgi:hypothetical protein
MVYLKKMLKLFDAEVAIIMSKASIVLRKSNVAMCGKAEFLILECG